MIAFSFLQNLLCQEELFFKRDFFIQEGLCSSKKSLFFKACPWLVGHESTD
jgi:hypothetical protein